MDWTAVAIADLRFSLQVASAAYARFADHSEIDEERGLLNKLSAERSGDAGLIARAAASDDLAPAEPRLDENAAAEMLGLGRSEPTSPASIAYRVQRAENSLGRTVSHLRTVTERPELRMALGVVRERIDNRRDDVRAMRRAAAARSESETARALAPGRSQALGDTLTVWFGTNRALDRFGRFVGERGDEVRYGRCAVFVPADREIGTLGSGWLKRLIRGDDRIKLTGFCRRGPSGLRLSKSFVRSNRLTATRSFIFMAIASNLKTQHGVLRSSRPISGTEVLPHSSAGLPWVRSMAIREMWQLFRVVKWRFANF
jgi:hypothetical protein